MLKPAFAKCLGLSIQVTKALKSGCGVGLLTTLGVGFLKNIYFI